ncbi:unnamed protein product [Rotaria sordida]|uniref:Uncharacterized protein n=1 Tax=Rotaria sordida TaxID=392033 RepID=A0A815KM02_9BILA|nr:unnamed protein product [Rotaria sordida]
MHLSYQLVIDDRSETLSFESEFNTICSTLSSNDALLLIANENKLHRFILVSHVCEIVGAFFEQDSLNIMTICKNGKVNYWTADMDLASMELIPYIPSENDN